MRYFLTLAFLIATSTVFAQEHIRCSDAEKMCEGYELQKSAASIFCEGANGVCETAPSICSQAMTMCSSIRTMQISAKNLCKTIRAECK